MRRGVLALLLFLALAMPMAARAADKTGALTAPHSSSRQVSYSNWVVEGQTVRLRVMLPKAAADAIAEPGKPPLRINEVAEYVHNQFTARSAGGKCRPIDQGEGFGEIYTMALTPGLYRYEIIFNCPSAEGVQLGDSLLFVRVPTHVNYARVQVNGAQPYLAVFDRDHQSVETGGRATATPAKRLAQLGALKLLRDFDRLAVLAGLLLMALAWRDLAVIVTGLAGGYLLSFVAAVWGGVALDPALGEGAIMLTAVILGAGVIRTHVRAPPLRRGGWIALALVLGGMLAAASLAAAVKSPQLGLLVGGLGLAGLAFVWLSGHQRPPWLLAAPAALFTFVGGMGQAADLALLQLPTRSVISALTAHDLGAAGVAIAIIAGAMALGWIALRRLSFLRNPFGEGAGAGLIGAGVFWFVSALVS